MLGASNPAFIRNRSRFLGYVPRELVHPPDSSRQGATLDATRLATGHRFTKLTINRLIELPGRGVMPLIPARKSPPLALPEHSGDKQARAFGLTPSEWVRLLHASPAARGFHRRRRELSDQPDLAIRVAEELIVRADVLRLTRGC